MREFTEAAMAWLHPAGGTRAQTTRRWHGYIQPAALEHKQPWLACVRPTGARVAGDGSTAIPPLQATRCEPCTRRLLLKVVGCVQAGRPRATTACPFGIRLVWRQLAATTAASTAPWSPAPASHPTSTAAPASSDTHARAFENRCLRQPLPAPPRRSRSGEHHRLHGLVTGAAAAASRVRQTMAHLDDDDAAGQQDQCSFSSLTHALSRRLLELQQLNCLKLDGARGRGGSGPLTQRPRPPAIGDKGEGRLCDAARADSAQALFTKDLQGLEVGTRVAARHLCTSASQTRCPPTAGDPPPRRPTCARWSSTWPRSSRSSPRRRPPSPRCLRAVAHAGGRQCAHVHQQPPGSAPRAPPAQ